MVHSTDPQNLFVELEEALSKIKIGIFRGITGRLREFALEHKMLMSLEGLGLTPADM